MTEAEILSQTQNICYFISFLTSDVPGAFYFNEADITKFLNHFKHLRTSHELPDDELIKMLSEYCAQSLQNIVQIKSEYIVRD